MSAFNLIDEPWIPVRFMDGLREEIGIREVLLRSKEIAVIEDPSPLVVAALHRFLLAVLYRALEGPTDIDQARALFREGMPLKKVEAYLTKWRDRFWLFDGKYPFYQVAAYEPREEKGKKVWKAWPVIAAEHNADNAKVLFDHVEIEAAGPIPSGKAARWLLACQTFSLGGGNSDFGYTKGAPSATAIMALPLGINLHDTLLLSLVPENRQVLARDLPVWEQKPVTLTALKNGLVRPAMGIADLYTWLSRAIKFNLADNGATVSKIAFAAGAVCSSGDFIDPMLGYRVDDDKGRLPLRFGERGLWRNFDSLLPGESDLAPRVVEHAAALTRTQPERRPRSVVVLGQANKKAKVEYWRMERFALPEVLGGDRNVRAEIRQLLDDATQTQKCLSSACWSFARDLLIRGKRDITKGDKKSIKGFVEQMSVNRCYWSTLEPRFHEILSQYTLEQDSEDVQREWLKSVRDALKLAWEQHRASVSTGDSWVIRAIVKAEVYVLRGLRALDARIAELEPQTEGV